MSGERAVEEEVVHYRIRLLGEWQEPERTVIYGKRKRKNTIAKEIAEELFDSILNYKVDFEELWTDEDGLHIKVWREKETEKEAKEYCVYPVTTYRAKAVKSKKSQKKERKELYPLDLSGFDKKRKERIKKIGTVRREWLVKQLGDSSINPEHQAVLFWWKATGATDNKQALKELLSLFSKFLRMDSKVP